MVNARICAASHVILASNHIKAAAVMKPSHPCCAHCHRTLFLVLSVVIKVS